MGMPRLIVPSFTQELMETVVEIGLAADPKLKEIAFNLKRAQRNFVIDAFSFRGIFLL
jgi:hypothetical protein